MMNVTILVPVLITNCQVSENPNTGPVIAQTNTRSRAIIKAAELPAQQVILLAQASKDRFFPFLSVFMMQILQLLNHKPERSSISSRELSTAEKILFIPIVGPERGNR